MLLYAVAARRVVARGCLAHRGFGQHGDEILERWDSRVTVDGEDRQSHLPAGRKAQLAAFVSEEGQVTVSALAERLGVSIDTIRRDLDQLSAEGVLIRTYGGAVSPSSNSRPDRAVDVRMTVQEKEKEAIAAIAYSPLVENSSSIMINGGTTTLALARALRGHRDLTIATNNLLIAPALSPTSIRDLYMFGGAVRPMTMATVGPSPYAVPAAPTSTSVAISD